MDSDNYDKCFPFKFIENLKQVGRAFVFVLMYFIVTKTTFDLRLSSK